jgi:hypothetical protein
MFPHCVYHESGTGTWWGKVDPSPEEMTVVQSILQMEEMTFKLAFKGSTDISWIEKEKMGL